MAIIKLCGGDIELANGMPHLPASASGPGRGSAALAATALLGHLPGVKALRGSSTSYAPSAAHADTPGESSDEPPAGKAVGSTRGRYDPQDRDRRFLATNASCIYNDLDHVELCLPEVRSAYDHVAAWHAMLRITRAGLERANADAAPERQIQVLVNNSDGQGRSFGAHLDFLVTREAWESICRTRLHYLAYLIAFQVSSIVLTGQGKVGSENRRAPVAFQLSQRADFFETITGIQTTFDRPLVNTRDEAHCGERYRGPAAAGDLTGRMARLHVIFFDSTLCHVASLLKVGAMQLVLAMIEDDEVDPELALDDPLGALRAWSHDPSLRARARLVSGETVTAVELQRRFVTRASRYVAGGTCGEAVSRAPEIIALWEDTVARLEARDWTTLSRRLDWVLKLSVLRSVMRQRPELTWASPELKHLDHIYSSLALDEGLYWSFERDGLTDRVVTEREINRLSTEPPGDTRAWTRAHVLRLARPGQILEVDWDRVSLDVLPSGGGWPTPCTLRMPDPLGCGRDQMARFFDGAASLEEVVARLAGRQAVRRA